MADIRFEIVTPLGFSVRTTNAYWQTLTIKHPDIANLENPVQQALQAPDKICQSSQDDSILLFYSLLRPQRWIVAVARRLNGKGFLITAYQTDAIKEGVMLWPK